MTTFACGGPIPRPDTGPPLEGRLEREQVIYPGGRIMCSYRPYTEGNAPTG